MKATLARRLFLSFLGGIYTVAFVSYWMQFDGLLGSDGLLPVNIFVARERMRHPEGELV
jgi:hypothetical protein